MISLNQLKMPTDVVLRCVQRGDDESLVKLYENFYSQQFPLDLSNVFGNIVAHNNGEIIGFGYLQLIAEATVLLDLSARPRDKFEALKKIIEYGKQVACSNNFDQLHIFAKDPNFVKILSKHLNFIKDDSCLVLNLDKTNEQKPTESC